MRVGQAEGEELGGRPGAGSVWVAGRVGSRGLLRGTPAQPTGCEGGEGGEGVGARAL